MSSILTKIQEYILCLTDIAEIGSDIIDVLEDFYDTLDNYGNIETKLSFYEIKLKKYVKVCKDAIPKHIEEDICCWCKKTIDKLKNLKPKNIEISATKIEDNANIRNIKRHLNNFKEVVYKNQTQCAKKIVEYYKDGCRVFMVKGQMQSGKTGVMLEIVRMFTVQQEFCVDNFRILSGINSKDWENQTRERFPNYLSDKINALCNFRKKGSDGLDICYIVDEAHVATKNKQTMSNFFNENGNVLNRDGKSCVIFISATPDNIGNDIRKIGNSDFRCKTVELEPGDGYLGLETLYNQGRIKDIPSVNEYTDINTDFLEEFFQIGSTEAKYHMYRCPIKGKNNVKYNIVKNRLHELARDDDRFCVREYIQNGDISAKDLEKEPLVHTIILLKDKLSCVQTICKKYLGNMMDRMSHNEAWVDQSLPGRACGYDSYDGIIYCNTELVISYIDNEGWKYKNYSRKYTTNTMLKSEIEKMYIPTTKNGIKLVCGISLSDENNPSESLNFPVFSQLHETKEDAISCIQQYYPTYECKKKFEPNEDFISQNIRGKNIKFTYEIFKREWEWGVNEHTQKRIWLLYENEVSNVYKFATVIWQNTSLP